MSALFQNDGPTKVSNADFQSFKEFAAREPYSASYYYTWLNESSSDGFRQLCLRNLIRSFHCPMAYTYRACCGESGIHCILHLGSSGPKKLRIILRNHPKLLNELVEEFLYCFDQRHFLAPSVLDINQCFLPEMIEFLLPLGVAEDRLWAQHPLHRSITIDPEECTTETGQPPFPIPNDFTKALELWSSSANIPQWIRDELWQKISNLVIAEIDKPENIETMRQEPFWQLGTTEHKEQAIRLRHTITLLYFLREQNYKKRQTAKRLEPCLQLLEDHMPSDIPYLCLDGGDYRFIAYLSNNTIDDQLALSFMRRHLTSFNPEGRGYYGSQKHTTFTRHELANLYWILGLVDRYSPKDWMLSHVTRHTSIDAKLIESLNSLIDYASQPEHQQ